MRRRRRLRKKKAKEGGLSVLLFSFSFLVFQLYSHDVVECAQQAHVGHLFSSFSILHFFSSCLIVCIITFIRCARHQVNGPATNNLRSGALLLLHDVVIYTIFACLFHFYSDINVDDERHDLETEGGWLGWQ